MNHKKLKKQLDDLRTLFKCPRLYLTNWFDEIKNDVDVAYGQKEIFETDPDLRTILRTNWNSIIERISLFETNCLKNQPTNKFNQHTTETTTQVINSIETNLIELYKLEQSVPTEETNKLIEDKSNLINDSISSQIIKLEKILFQKKTIAFISSHKSSIFLANKVFHRMDSKTTAGKLLVINDEYFNKSSIEIFKENIKRLTNELIRLGRLKAIDLSSDNIDEISLNLNALEEITLSVLNHEFIDQDLFNGLMNLKRIELIHNQSTQINSLIFQELTQLEELSLFSNQLISIDKELFARLDLLTILNVSCNQIKELDPMIFKDLVSLKILDLHSNQLETLNENIFNNLINLEWINLSSNKLEIVDKRIFKNLVKLSSIHLYDNKIVDIDKELFKGLKLLTRINLSNNKIKELDSNVFKNLSSLISIGLNGNQIRYLDKDIFNGLFHLNHIELHNNQFINEKSFELNLEHNVTFVSFKSKLMNECLKNDLCLVIKQETKCKKFAYVEFSKWLFMLKIGVFLLFPFVLSYQNRF